MVGKITYGFLIVLISSTCNPDNKNSVRHKYLGLTLSPYKPGTLAGEWAIAETESRGVRGNFYISPRINFRNNGKAVVAYPDNKSGSYDWSIHADTLRLQCTEPSNTFPFFSSLKYKMTYYGKKDYTELTLETDSMIYFLRR